jgi:large repetitive protein
MASGQRFVTRAFILGALLGSVPFLPGCQDYLSTTLTTGPAGNSQYIAVSPSGTIPVDIGKSIRITAVVVGDQSGEGVTWGISGPGSLGAQTTSTVIYQAPSSGVGSGAYVTAYSVAAPTQYFISTILLTALPSFVTTTLPGGTAGAAYDNVVTVTAGAPPFAWSVVSGSLPPGLSYSVGSLESLQIEGTPTTAGTYNFTLEATDATGGTTQQALSIVIAAAPAANGLRAQLLQNPAFRALSGDSSNNQLLAGKYAFLFSGKNNGVAAVAAAGSFSADGAGNITSGIADRNGPQGPQTAVGFTGTYNVGADHLGIMMLNFADGSSAAYALAASAEGGARFIEFDDLNGSGTRGAGEIAKQDASAFSMAKVAGNYVFALNGNDANSQPMAMVGTFAASTSGSIVGGGLEVAQHTGITWDNSPGASSRSGAYTVDVSGRGVATFGLTGANGFEPGPLNLSFTVVSAKEWFAIETDGSNKPILSGLIRVGIPSGGVASFSLRDYLSLNDGTTVVLDEPGLTAKFVPETTVQPHSVDSLSGVLAGATDFQGNLGDSEFLTSLNFDGTRTAQLVGVTSSSDGLAIVPRQKATYSIGGSAISFETLWINGHPLTGSLTSAAAAQIGWDDRTSPVALIYR